jgi:hypothetical protein
MAEQIIKKETTSKSKGLPILLQIVQWSVLAMLLFTGLMAAYRKFGG